MGFGFVEARSIDQYAQITHIVCMKRTNVILDEELLEKARQALGERTYSATISKALAEIVRVSNLKQTLAEFARRNVNGAMFDRAYVEERYPDAAAHLWPQKRRASADEVRAPKRSKKVNRRGTR